MLVAVISGDGINQDGHVRPSALIPSFHSSYNNTHNNLRKDTTKIESPGYLNWRHLLASDFFAAVKAGYPGGQDHDSQLFHTVTELMLYVGWGGKPVEKMIIFVWDGDD